MSDDEDLNEVAELRNRDDHPLTDGSCSEGDDDVQLWRNEIALLRKHNDPDIIVDGENLGAPGALKDPQDLTEIVEIAKSDIAPSKHNVLVLNHSVVLILQNLLRSVKISLKRNNKEQEEFEKYLEFIKRKRLSSQRSAFPSFSLCGIPFFKQNDMLPPKNSYTRQMEASNYVMSTNLIKPASSWMTAELKDLRDLVINLAKETELDKWESQCNGRRNLGAASLEFAAKELKKLKNQPPEINSSRVDWLRVAANLKSQSNFSPNECEAAWTHIIGTHNNISKWRKEEKTRLFELAEKYYFQNWDAIALKLGNGRSGWQCCIQFQRRFLVESYPWDPSEDQKLKDLVAVHSKGNYIPWFKIYYYFENRTGRQIRERYSYRLRPSKKGKFSIAEDEAILSVTEAYKGNAQILKKYFPERALPAVYKRYRKLMSDKDKFTGAEDQALIEAVAVHGRDWNVVVEALPGRQIYEIRNRYARLLEFTEDFLRGVNPKDESGSRVLKSLPAVRSEAAVFAVMQLMCEPKLPKDSFAHTIRGVSVDVQVSAPMKEILRLLQFGGKHLFGPKLATPRFAEERKAMAARLAYLSTVLSVPCNFSDIAANLEKLPTFGHPEEVMLVLRELPTPVFSSVCAQCWVPPSALTLLGLRIIYSVKSYLLAESSLCNRNIAAWRDENVAKEERLTATCAKSRLRSRMIHIFFLSACIAKITRNVIVAQPKIQKRKKPLSYKRVKQHTKLMAKARWNKAGKKVGKRKRTAKTEEEVNDLPKKAKMIRVTQDSKSNTNVRLINSSSYGLPGHETQVLDEPVAKKQRGRPRKKL